MRVAILGVGRLGAFHAKVLSETKDVDELRVYDADAARAKEVAGPLKAKAAASVDEALQGVDTAVIVTPTDTHALLIKKCLDARIATFCEKPIAISTIGVRDRASFNGAGATTVDMAASGELARKWAMARDG